MEHSVPLSGTVVWHWNNSMETPTFTPSLLRYAGGSRPRCHTIITSGMIQFCSDCTHALAGRTVPMVDWDTILKEEHMEGEANTQAPAPAENAAAPTPIDSAKAAPPHPGFDRAVAHLQFGGFSEEVAKHIVNDVGIDTVLDAVSKSGSLRPPGGLQKDAAANAAPSLLSSLAPSSSEPADKEKTQESAPEPGMKRCSACGTWYPGGYELCPHDNTRLQ